MFQVGQRVEQLAGDCMNLSCNSANEDRLIIPNLTTGREIASRRRLKKFKKSKTQKVFTCQLFGTFRLFVFLVTFRLFGTFRLFVFLVTFRLFGTF